MKTRLLGAVALLLLTATPALAHRLKLFATQSGEQIEGEAFFIGGGRPDGATVIIHDPAGTELARLTTDAQGAFRWKTPHPDAYRISVDSGDGHAATLTLASPAAAPPPPPQASSPAAPLEDSHQIEAAVERALARRLDPLIAAQIETESHLRLNDLIGGIGYIIGLAGLGLAWKARQKR